MNSIFVHGWGMDSDIWKEISKHFPAECTSFVNFGFIDDITNIDIPNNDSQNIFITHSLGALWALKHHAHDMAGLIVINGFTNFTNFVPERTLRTMQKRLRRNPQQQMQKFWSNCGINHSDKNLNIDQLNLGLEWLINWDMSAELKNLNVPILSLIGAQDTLLQLDKMEKEWSATDIIIIKDGGHILPLSHPEWCIKKIREFTSEYKLER